MRVGILSFSIFLYASIDCTICHNGRKAINLNKLSSKEIKKELQLFKKGKGNKVMISIAKHLDEKEIDKLSKKYGKK